MQPTLSNRIPHLPPSSPIVSIVKGMTFVLVQLDSLETLAAVSTGAFSTDVQLDEEWKPSFTSLYFYVTLPENHDGTRNIRTRMIEGSLEDPATGSAACALSCYLSLACGTPGRSTYKYAITQAVEIGRKSDIGVEVTVESENKQIGKVQLIGGAVKVMEGNIVV